MNYKTALFEEVDAINIEIAEILTAICFGNSGLIKVLPDSNKELSVVHGYSRALSDEADFIIESLPDTNHYQSVRTGRKKIQYNPETVSPIYLSALERRLKDSKKMPEFQALL